MARCIVEQLDGLLDGAVKNVTRQLLPGGAASAGVLAGSGPASGGDASEHAAAGGLAALFCVAASVLAVAGASAAGRRASSVAATCLALCAITAMIAITAVAFANADLTNWAPRAMRGALGQGMRAGALTKLRWNITTYVQSGSQRENVCWISEIGIKQPLLSRGLPQTHCLKEYLLRGRPIDLLK